MGLRDWLRRTPHTALDDPPPPMSRRGAVAPVAGDGTTSPFALAPLPSTRVSDPRQAKARLYAAQIGFVGRTYDFIAHQAARCPWTVEQSLDGGETWAVLPIEVPDPNRPADADALVVDLSAELAWDIMRLIRPERGDQSDLMRQSVKLHGTVGEFYIIDVSQGERTAFIVRDPQLCEPEHKRQPKGPWIIRDTPDGKVSKGTARRVSADRVFRHWMEDTNAPLMATSSLIGLVDDIDTYYALRRHLQRQTRGRLAMDEVFWSPTEAHAEKIQVNGAQVSKLDYNLARSAAARANDLDDSMIETVAPFLLNTPGGHPVPQMIKMGALGQDLLAYLQDQRRLIAGSLPLSASFVLDEAMSAENHWNEWLADNENEELIKADQRKVDDSFTLAIFRPALRMADRAGALRHDPETLRISQNTTIIRRQLDNSENVKWARERNLISDDATLEGLRLNPADRPTDVQLAEMERAVQFWGTAKVTAGSTMGMLPSAQEAVPNGGLPPAARGALASIIDDTYLLEP